MGGEGNWPQGGGGYHGFGWHIEVPEVCSWV